MIERRTLLAMLGAASIVGCSGTGNSPLRPSSGAVVPLTVGLTYVPNVQFCAFYLGQDRGIFREHGIDITLRHHGEQEDVFGALLYGQESVVFASADEAMVAAAEGNDLRTFATSYQTYPLELIGLGEGPDDLGALAGSIIGIPGHYGSSYYAALAAVHQAGLGEGDVTLLDIGYTQLSALQAGEVDYIVGFSNNEAVQLAGLGMEPRRMPIVTEPLLVGPSLVVNGDEVESEILARLASALKAAEEAVAADPEAALEATTLHVPALVEDQQREAAAAVLKATVDLWRRDGQISVAVDPLAFERMGSFLLDAGIISAVPANSYLML